jgi:putative CocE/NonD family hydrolase
VKASGWVVALCASVLAGATLFSGGASAAPAASTDINAAPPAIYPHVYSEQQFITMDDGVKLGATLSFPSDNGTTPAPGTFPVVLDMTPYGRDFECSCDSASTFASRGFILAVVDVRGTGGSQGNLNGNYFSPRESQDGYDLVEYLGTQPWSNGKVAMSGGSYLGIVQYNVAELDPPHLAAIVPDEALADLYNDAYAPGGIPSIFFDAQYLGVQGAPGLLTPNTAAAMLPGTVTAKLDQLLGRSVAFDYLANPYDDAFYAARSPITNVDKIKVPVLVLDGWRDAFAPGNIRMFQALEARPNVETDLHVDPCTHKGCGGIFAPTDNPPDSDNVVDQELNFLEPYLRGASAPALPRVRLYVQSADQYVDSDQWPLSATTFTREYLGNGSITTSPVPVGSASYITNPTAGLSMTLDEPGTVAVTPYLPLDQRLEAGQGLTWRTTALTQTLTLAGPIALHLVASSTAPDTDWFAKLSDVAPNGAVNIVAEGQLRASLRALAPQSTFEEPLQLLTTPKAIMPGTFYDYDISIAPTAYAFAPGHRLQLQLTSSNLPNALPATIDLNTSDAAASRVVPLLPATNTVRYGGPDATSLSLPLYG